MLNAPIVSEQTTYQKPESGEGRRQPWPDAGLVGPSARGVAAVRLGVAGIGHLRFTSLGTTDADKQIANRPECSCPHRLTLLHDAASTTGDLTRHPARQVSSPSARDISPTHLGSPYASMSAKSCRVWRRGKPRSLGMRRAGGAIVGFQMARQSRRHRSAVDHLSQRAGH